MLPQSEVRVAAGSLITEPSLFLSATSLFIYFFRLNVVDQMSVTLISSAQKLLVTH